jgi:hypothetical protein
MPMVPPVGLNAQGVPGGSAAPGISPENFLMAAADLHSRGQLSAPVPQGKPLAAPATRPKRRLPDMKVVR